VNTATSCLQWKKHHCIILNMGDTPSDLLLTASQTHPHVLPHKYNLRIIRNTSHSLPTITRPDGYSSSHTVHPTTQILNFRIPHLASFPERVSEEERRSPS